MSKKTSATVDTPESTDPVASQLGVARLRLGWTLEEASARTRLHLNVIRRLEAGVCIIMIVWIEINKKPKS